MYISYIIYYILHIIYSRKWRIKGRDSSSIICALDGAGMHAFYAVIGGACMHAFYAVVDGACMYVYAYNALYACITWTHTRMICCTHARIHASSGEISHVHMQEQRCLMCVKCACLEAQTCLSTRIIAQHKCHRQRQRQRQRQRRRCEMLTETEPRFTTLPHTLPPYLL